MEPLSPMLPFILAIYIAQKEGLYQVTKNDFFKLLRKSYEIAVFGRFFENNKQNVN